MTLSIAAPDQSSGWFGAPISSSSISVASRCLHWRPGVGIASGQNITDPRLGQYRLSQFADDISVKDALTAGVDAGGEAGPLHSARVRHIVTAFRGIFNDTTDQ